MAIFNNIQITVNGLGGGNIAVQVGPEGFVTSISALREMVKGRRKDLDFLVFQVALQLDANNQDPGLMTLLELKNAVEAMTLKW